MRTSGIRTSRDRTSGGPPVLVSKVSLKGKSGHKHNFSWAYLVIQFFQFYALILFGLVDFFCRLQSKISASAAFLLEFFLFLLLLAKVIY